MHKDQSPIHQIAHNLPRSSITIKKKTEELVKKIQAKT
jgi:hypothetical protein